MFLKNIPVEFTRAVSNLTAKATSLSPRLKVSAAFLTLCLTVGAVWIQPTFASSAPAPTPASISLSSIADYFWSFFGTSNDGHKRPPRVNRGDAEPYNGQRQTQEPIPAAALPCTPTGVTLAVPGTYATIQLAINAANPTGGDKIVVAAGNYTEQLSINKCVTIEGAGVGTTNILSPPALTASTVTGFGGYAIVEVRGNSYVTITGVTISGPVPFGGAGRTHGIFVSENATLKMTNSRVTALHGSGGINGVQDGVGIRAGSTAANTTGILDLDNVTVDDFQKNGIDVDRTGSSATITNSTVAGIGPTSVIAQNGIFADYGADLTVTNSIIKDLSYTPGTWASIGIGPYDSGSVVIDNNQFIGVDEGVYAVTSSIPVTPKALSITNNTFTNNLGWGIIYMSHSPVTITDNVISGSNVGIEGDIFPGQVSTISRNSITQATGTDPAAIYFWDSGTTTTATINVNFNRISSNGAGGLDGIYNDTQNAVNAENNWWGCNAGPGGSGCDIVNGSGANLVDSSPWLTLTGITADPSPIAYNGTSNISGVSLCTNSALANVCTVTDHIIDGTPLGYGTNPATAGSVSPTSSTFVSGLAVAGTTFTAGAGPFVGDQTEAVGATLDNQTITANVVVHDSTPPTFASLARVGGPLTGAATVQFTATFSEPVNAGVAHFSVVEGGGVTGASVTAVNCSGNSCTIDVNTGSGSGTLGLTIPTSSGITDTATNPLGGGPYPSSDSFTVDKDVPTGTLVQASGQPDPTGASPVHFTVTFTDPSGSAISGFDATDVVVATGTGTAFNSATPSISVTGSGPYDVAVSGMDQPGQVTITVGAGAVVDAAGNSGADVVEGDNTVYYTSGASTLIVDTDGAASDVNFPASCSDSTPTAYTTIQAAINAASNGNTIKVCPGVYEENVVVDRSVSILGPNATIDPNGPGPFNPSAVVVPATVETSLQSSTSGTVFRVGTSSGHVDVAIKGLTIDGHNSSLTGGRTLNGVEMHTGGGIISSTGSFDNETSGFDVTLDVENNIIQNFERYGVYISGVSSGSTVLSGNNVSRNKFDNMPSGNTFSGERGRAAAFGWDVYGTFSHNVVTRANVGWQDDNHYQASPGAGTLVDSNEIHAYHRGIFHNLQYSNASPATISNNTLIAETAGASLTNFGIQLASIQSVVGVTLSNNNISGHVYGYLLWNVPSTTSATIAGGTLKGNEYGIYVTNNDPQFGAGSASVNVDVSCVNIYGNTNGVSVGTGITDFAITTSNIVGNGTGLVQDGASTVSANGNYWGATNGPATLGLGDVFTGASFPTFITVPDNCSSAPAFPTVTINQTGSQDPTNSATVHFTVQFSQPVTGLDGSKVRLSGTAGATTATVVSGSGAGPYDVEVSGMTGPGTIIADLYAGSGFTVAGLPSVASTSTDNTVTYDNVAPTVISIVRDGSTPTNAASVTFTVTFSEPVNNVDTTDFALATTGSIAGANISNVTGSGTTYTVTVATGTGDGNIGLNIPSGSDIADAATNTLSNLPFTGEVYTIDRTGPNSTVSPVADPDTTSPVDFTVNFGETVTGFDAADVSISGTANPTGFTIDGSYTVHVTGMNQSGTVTVSVNNAGVTDSLGNAGTGTSSASAQFNQQSTPSVSSTTAPNGWFYWQDNGDTLISNHDYVFGPSGGPLPTGSARLQNGASDLKGLFTFQFRGTRLDAITTLKYSTYVPTGTSAAPSLQIGVDFTGADSPAPTYQGRLVYVPSGVVNDTWQTWNLDLSTAKFYYSSNTYSPSGDGCKFSEGTGCTLATILNAHPNARVMPIADPSNADPNNTWGVVGFRTQNNEISYVDNFVIGINSANTVVNFEPAGAMVSTPSSPNGWFYWEDDDDHLVTGYDYVFGPLGGPLPVGSARVASGTTPGDQKKGLFTFQYRGTRLDQLTTLKYSTYAATADDVPYFQISVDFTGNANPGYQGRLVYVPSENGTFTANTWQTWDLLASGAKFYYSSGNYSPNGDGCLESEGNGGCTLATILAAHPNARVMPIADPIHPDPNNTWGIIGVRTDPGTSGNIDNVIVGVNGADTTFNFEPAGVVVSTPVSPKGWFSWDDTTDVPCDSEYVSGPAGGPLPVGSAHLSSSTCSGAVPTTDKKGFFTKAFQGARLDQITTLKYSTYVASGSTSKPSFDIGVDFTGAANPAYQGRLVYTPSVIVNDTWQQWDLLAPGTKFFYSSTTYSPNDGLNCQLGGSGCTLADILNLHPNLRIMPNDDSNPLVPDTWGVLGIRMDADANANVDNIIVGVNGAVNTFDFEAEPPTVSIANANATEGSNVDFTVTLTGDTPARTMPVTVVVNTSDGTATAPGDYTPAVSQVVTFAPGVSSQTVSVATATDNVAEGDETFTATLSNAVNAGIATTSATGTINDGAGYIAIGGQITAYTGGAGIPGVTVTLTGTNIPPNTTATTDSTGHYNFNTGISTTGLFSVQPSCPLNPTCTAYVYDPNSQFVINPASNVTFNFLGYTNDNPRSVVIGNPVQSQVGANVVVPVTLNATGTEGAFNSTLNYNNSILHFVSASGPVGTTITVPPGSPQSPLNLLVESDSGQYPAGPLTVNLTFTATPGTATSTPINFGSGGVVSNSQGISVPAVWVNGSVTFATGLEGDITDNVTGGYTNGFVNALDVSRLRRLVVGSESFNTNVNDFQRADVSPYPLHGDGCINGLDVIAIRKLQSGEFPFVPASGPTAPPCGGPLHGQTEKNDLKNRPSVDTVVQVVGTQAAPGGTANVQVQVVAQGSENVLTFTMAYDSNVFASNPVFTMGNSLPGGTILDAFSPTSDRTNVGLYLPNNIPMQAGTVIIINVAFQVKANAPTGLTPIIFTGSLQAGPPIVGDVSGAEMPSSWENGEVLITLAPTAATSSVGGQVRTADGRGIGNTVVTLTGTDGSVRRALTNQMGYYRIDNVPTGATYVLGATSKRFTFDSRVVTVGDNITDADITPRE